MPELVFSSFLFVFLSVVFLSFCHVVLFRLFYFTAGIIRGTSGSFHSHLFPTKCWSFFFLLIFFLLYFCLFLSFCHVVFFRLFYFIAGFIRGTSSRFHSQLFPLTKCRSWISSFFFVFLSVVFISFCHVVFLKLFYFTAGIIRRASGHFHSHLFPHKMLELGLVDGRVSIYYQVVNGCQYQGDAHTAPNHPIYEAYTRFPRENNSILDM